MRLCVAAAESPESGKTTVAGRFMYIAHYTTGITEQKLFGAIEVTCLSCLSYLSTSAAASHFIILKE